MESVPKVPVHLAYEPDHSNASIAIIAAVAITPITIGLAFAGIDNYGRMEDKVTAVLVYGIVVGLLTWFTIWLYRVYFRHRRKVRTEAAAFAQYSQQTLARIVGREIRDGGEYSDTYYVYYQFRDDFIVKAALSEKQKPYYELPLGGLIDIEYLTNNPTVSRLK